MQKKIAVLTVRLVIDVNDGVNINDFLNNMDYSFTPSKSVSCRGADIIDTEITDWEIADIS